MSFRTYGVPAPWAQETLNPKPLKAQVGRPCGTVRRDAFDHRRPRLALGGKLRGFRRVLRSIRL